MKTTQRFSPYLAVLLTLALALSSLGLLAQHAAAAPKAAPSSLPASMPVLPQVCTSAGGAATCALTANEGTLTMAGYNNIPFWGFVPASSSLAPAVMTVTQGDVVTVTLQNNLSFPVSVVFGSQEGVEASTDGGFNWERTAFETDPLTDVMVSMVQSAPAGGQVQYRFTASNPGTYLFKSGTDAGRQVTMGLFGALVVRPLADPLTAYNAGTAFDNEALLILSELDPDFNANPAQSLDLYKPKFQLINGLPYPAAGMVEVDPDASVLLRYINAGLMEHTLGTLGVNQTIIARDGNLLPYSAGAVVESVAPGETVDTLVKIPAVVPASGVLYPVYQANSILHNNSEHAPAPGPDDPKSVIEFGGMLTFLHAVGTDTNPVVGPMVTNIGVDPLRTNGASGVTLTATFNGTPGAARYYIDDLTAPISATLAGSGISVNIDAATLGGWESDDHTFYVQAEEAGVWGPLSSAAFTLDKVGPETTGLVLTPAQTNGTVDVALRATGNDREFGASTVAGARFGIDMGSPVDPVAMQPMTGNSPAVPLVVGFDATIPAATVNALAEGEHIITVLSQDEVQPGENNWGPVTTIELTVDKTGPVTTGVALSPATVNFNAPITFAEVRVTATINDNLSGGVNSAVVAAEGFINVAGANGQGFKVFPTDGLFDEVDEEIYFNIPVREFTYLNAGAHTVLIHGRDAAGNWGSTVSGEVTVVRSTIDTAAPTITTLTATPLDVAPAAAGVTFMLQAVVEDESSAIAQALWYADETVLFSDAYPLLPNDGLFDSSFEVLEAIIDTSSWTNGTHTLYVRVSDEVGNWSAVKSVTITVNNADNSTISNGNQYGWSGIIGNLAFTPEAVLGGGQVGMEATLDGAPGYAYLNTPAGETAITASFLFNPNNALLAHEPVDIFVATNDEPVFGIKVAPYTNNQSGYMLSAWVNDYGVTQTTKTFHIEANQTHKLSVSWEAGVNKSFKLLIDDKVVGTISSLNTSAYRLHQLRLGTQTSVTEFMSGQMYFDAFLAERQVVPGPFWIYLPSIKR